MFTWTDYDGNLWLYGGGGVNNNWMYAVTPLTELWKYNIQTNEWTWMWGDSTEYLDYPVLGAFQTPDPLSSPGGLTESQVAWVDNDGNLWMYGGQFNLGGLCNTIWKFDIGSNQWAWMAGNDSIYPSVNYGIKGQYGPNTNPGGRRVYTYLKDQNGLIWIFCGNSAPNYNYLGFSYDDVWVFNPDSLEWKWVDGPDSTDFVGNAGANCDTSSDFIPGSRMENSMYWTDDCNNLWMYGGMKDDYASYPYITPEPYEDFWCYNMQSNLWIKIKGNPQLSSIAPIYGVQGIPDTANWPGSRMGGACWQDKNGAFYLYGGMNFYGEFFGDLWRYARDPACPGAFGCPLPAFSALAQNICEKLCTNFFDQSASNPTSWQWSFPGGSPDSSSDQNPTNICYNNPGAYDVTLITTSASVNDTILYPGFINVYPTPTVPTITQTGDTLTSSSATSYQWQLNLTDIPGATNQSYIATADGYYTVVVYSEYGCYATTTIYIEGTGIVVTDSSPFVSVYPNPGDGKFNLRLKVPSKNTNVRIYNYQGNIILNQPISIRAVALNQSIDISKFPSGCYVLEIQTDQIEIRQKLVVIK